MLDLPESTSNSKSSVGAPRSSFANKVLKDIAAQNQFFTEWEAKRLYPENVVAEFLFEGEDQNGEHLAFEDYQDCLRVINGTLVFAVGKLTVQLGPYAVLDEKAETEDEEFEDLDSEAERDSASEDADSEPEPSDDLPSEPGASQSSSPLLRRLKTRVPVAPYLRGYISYLNNNSEHPDAYTYETLLARFINKPAYQALKDEHKRLTQRVLYRKYVSEHALLHKIAHQVPTELSEYSLVKPNPKYKRVVQLRKQRATRNTTSAPVPTFSFEVSAFGCYIVLVLSQMNLFRPLMDRFGPRLVPRLLELTCLMLKYRNFRLNSKRHLEYCTQHVSLSLKTVDTNYYTDTYKLARTEYLQTEKAKEDGVTNNFYGLMDAYVLCNREAFLASGYKDALLTGDGTSILCRSRAELVKYGYYNATGEIESCIKEYLFLERKSRLVLFQQFHPGNFNDYQATPQALQHMLSNDLALQINLQTNLRMTRDAGCTTAETTWLDIKNGFEFFNHIKGDYNKHFTKAREEIIAEYCLKEGVPLHQDIFQVIDRVEDDNEHFEIRHLIKTSKTYTAAQLGICNAKGQPNLKTATKEDAKKLKGAKIDPDSKVQVVLSCPNSYSIQRTLLKEGRELIKVLEDVNDGLTEYRNLKAVKQSLLKGLTLTEFADLSEDTARQMKLHPLWEKVNKLRRVHPDWQIQSCVHSVSYKQALTDYTKKRIVDVPKPEDHLGDVFVYTIDKSKFMQGSYASLYHTFITNYDGPNVADQTSTAYDNRMFAESGNRLAKFVDGDTVMCNNLESYSIRRICTYLCVSIIGFVQQMHIEDAFRKNPDITKVSFPTPQDIADTLSQQKLIVNYYDKTVKVKPNQIRSNELRNMLRVLGITELTDLEARAMLEVFWNQVDPRQRTRVEKLSTSERDTLINELSLPPDDDNDLETPAIYDKVTSSTVNDTRLLQDYQKLRVEHARKPKKKFLKEMNELALAMKGFSSWSQAASENY